MAGESQLPPHQEPDPSDLTQAAIDRAGNARSLLVDAQFRILDARLDAMDKAARVLHETVTRTPTDIQQAIGHLKEVMGVELGAVAQQFAERDTRSERESRDNKLAVDAAFAAQEKQAAAQNKSNAEAIAKSEEATKETIGKLEKLFDTSIKGLGDKIDDGKDRTNVLERILGDRLAGIERSIGEIGANKRGGKEQLTAIYAMAGFLVTMLIIAGFLAAAGVFGGQ